MPPRRRQSDVACCGGEPTKEETCPHRELSKKQESRDRTSSALGVDKFRKSGAHKPARWGGGTRVFAGDGGYGSKGVDRRRQRIPGREAISRGRGAKRGEKESKRHHGSTEQQNTTVHVPCGN